MMCNWFVGMENNKKPSNALTTPAPRGSLVSFVVNRIEEALINNELKPGDFLPPEAELSKNLNVGKTSVREALKMLQAMGVVKVNRGKASQIRKRPGKDSINPLIFKLIMEERDVQDIIDLRMMFEPAFTVMAMKRATDEEIEAIRKTVESFEETINLGAQKAEDDLAFHLTILKATHNPFVIRIGETILQLFKSSISISMNTIPEIALRDHKKILEAFLKKDENKLGEEVIASFEGWRQSLENS